MRFSLAFGLFAYGMGLSTLMGANMDVALGSVSNSIVSPGHAVGSIFLMIGSLCIAYGMRRDDD